jgi:hypothetical protein
MGKNNGGGEEASEHTWAPYIEGRVAAADTVSDVNMKPATDRQNAFYCLLDLLLEDIVRNGA